MQIGQFAGVIPAAPRGPPVPATAGGNNNGGNATREIDKQAGIYYAAWTRCNQKMTSGPENAACFS